MIGFVLFTTDYNRTFEETAHAPSASETAGEHAAPAHAPIDPHARLQFADRWSGRQNWAWVDPDRTNVAGKATVLYLGYRIDHLSGIMFLMVTLIATLIHIFSIGYMGDELEPDRRGPSGPRRRRTAICTVAAASGASSYFLSLFCFSMLNLILADNLFQVFVSWELVGHLLVSVDRLLLRTP